MNSTTSSKSPPVPALDTSVPALILKIGHYPLHHGGLGAIRSLGRCGVDVYAITEDRYTPAAVSRYLRGHIVWPTSGREEPAHLVEGLLQAGRRIGRPAVLVPTDEEAAVLVAEHADSLQDQFVFPTPRDPRLVRLLASKQGVHEICRESGVPSPWTVTPDSHRAVEDFASVGCFPVVAKNSEAYVRRSSPAVAGTTLVEGPAELRAMARRWGEPPGVVLQEYLPRQQAEDWIVHGYVDRDSVPRVLFTGVKVRSWPPHAGMTACAYAIWNPELADTTTELCKRIGFHGILDLDWRLDRRDGRYKLLDFNPRAGAQFRLFETSSGVDVVRAQHLDLTGQDIPEGRCPEGRRFVVENIDLPARLGFWRSGYTTPHAPRSATTTEWGWFATDDLAPILPMVLRHGGPLAAYISQTWHSRRRTSREERS
jgi:D-aspartate ligase